MIAQKLGRYEVVSEIGRGAMGVVYKAADPMLNRTVAIKTISMSLDPNERQEYEARFFQEAKAAGGLNHPNIVTVYDIGNSGNIAYMAMEYLEGLELRALLTGGKSLKIDQAISTAAQIAEGLGYAHERGVVHRDIKPPNIMILRDGLVKITDFGIARMRTSEVQTQTGKLMGSPKYMSPEQVIGKRADPRADIFSLGVILYEMLTGSTPFSGESVSALMYQIVNFIPPAPSVSHPEVPEMLDYIVAKMLAKKLDERYASAKDVANDLRECARLINSGAQAQAPATPRPHSSVSAGPATDLVHTDTRQMLRQDIPQDRRIDGEEAVADTSPAALGISRSFDSLEATQKLAAQAGLAQDLEGFTTTLQMSKPGAAPQQAISKSAAGWEILDEPARGAPWSGRDTMVIAASAFAGLVVAAVIVLY